MDYPASELKELLRSHNSVTTGPKAELIARLESFNANIWHQLDEERRLRAEAERQQGNAENGENQMHEANAEEDHRSSEENEDACVNVPVVSARRVAAENELLVRELDLMRRGRDIGLRELQLLRREAGAQQSSLSSPRFALSNATSATMSEHTIDELLCDFSGKEGLFLRWRQQLTLLRNSYQLDDAATRVLIC